jgi:predicted nucleic acid-binding Zn ribbon protein
LIYKTAGQYLFFIGTFAILFQIFGVKLSLINVFGNMKQEVFLLALLAGGVFYLVGRTKMKTLPVMETAHRVPKTITPKPVTTDSAFICPSCSYENQFKRKYCIACGNALTPRNLDVAPAHYCIHCGSALDPEDRFCGDCGQLRYSEN